ncbi:hypothetical protein HDV02_005874 [Globomyces sp. JEL0801]|nr:hypothetical protein HDV02_005874 [Globomyces sp. JEL0801]
MRPTKWIVIEGLDGTGKTSMSKGIASRLENSIISPSPDQNARSLFDVCSNPIRRSFYFLWNSVTKEFALNQLALGKNVITDRWLFSTIAYMNCMDIVVDEVSQSLITFNKCYPTDRMPDITVYLHTDQKTRIERLKQRDGIQHTKEEIALFDSQTQELLHQEFLKQGSFDLIIDTSDLTIEQVLDCILREILK